MSRLTVTDLARVVYSSGKVFDGLRTGRLDTENFLRSGDTTGVTSRADLALLEDMRDVAQFVVDHGEKPIDASYIRSVNAQLTRSAALHPGEFRTDEQGIGVNTRHGKHEPPQVDDESLQEVLDRARSDDPEADAVDLFVALAKAQPFEDGNKRTALFVANSRLIGAGSGTLLSIPVDEDDPSVADGFNDALARAYVFGDDAAVKGMLREQGIAPVPSQEPPSPLDALRQHDLRTGAGPAPTGRAQETDLQRRQRALSDEVADLDWGDGDEQPER